MLVNLRGFFFTTLVALGPALLAVSLGGLASSYDPEWEDDDNAYDRARRAVSREEALPMAQLLDQIQKRIPGEVVGVEFEREHGRWVYEFKIVDDEGRLLEVYVDAKTGEVLSVEDD